MIFSLNCRSYRSLIEKIAARERIRRRARIAGPARFRPTMEGLERRIALSTIAWNVTLAGGGGDWDVASNWVGGKVPGPADMAIIPKLVNTGIVYLNRNQSDAVGGLTTDPSVTFQVLSGSLSLTAASRSTFGGNVSVSTGASMSFGAGADLTVGAGQTVDVNGALTFNDGAQVSFLPDDVQLTRIIVGGTLTATASSFTATGSSENCYLTLRSTGRLIASDCTFSLGQVVLGTNAMQSGDLVGNVFENGTVLVVPYRWVNFLSENASLGDIAIDPGTISSGALALNAIGTDVTNLRYVFPGGFTIGSRAAVNVGPGVTVVIPANQTLTVNGLLNFGVGDQVLFTPDTSQPSQIVVGGTLSASGSAFSASNSNDSAVLVNSGGNLQADNCQFAVSRIALGSGSAATMTTDQLGDSTATTQLWVDSTASIDISGNDFSQVGADGVVATGDPSAHISLAQNYWGTRDTGTIDGMILDHRDVASLPTVDYQPIIIGHSVTAAAAASATFSATDQTVMLMAAVTTADGNPLSEGTERFSIWNGLVQVGQYTGWVSVSGGTASANYHASRRHSGGYLPHSGRVQRLGPLPSGSRRVTVAHGEPGSHGRDAGRRLDDLRLADASNAGPDHGGGKPRRHGERGDRHVHGASGGNPVGNPVVGKSRAGWRARTTFAPGFPGGSYTIQAVYSDPTGNFLAATGYAVLTVAPAATTVTDSDARTVYNAYTGEPIVLYASVSSPAGTISEGSVTFTIFDGATPVMPPIVIAVTNGIAAGNAQLPAGTAAKTYDLRVVYSGTGNYAASPQSVSVLTVSPAATTTIAGNATATFSPSDQTLSLTAGVTSGGMSVGEGSVTFIVRSGSTVVGTASASVNSGQARANLNLPAGTTAGTYDIQVSYDDGSTGNYRASSADAALAVAKATPLISWAAPDPIPYGTRLSATQLDATTTVPGSFTYAPRAGTRISRRRRATPHVQLHPRRHDGLLAGHGHGGRRRGPGHAHVQQPHGVAIDHLRPVVRPCLGQPVGGCGTPRGQVVSISIGPASATAPVRADGSFAAIIDIHALIASTSPYHIVYDYAGDANFEPTFDASTTLTVNQVAPVIAWAAPRDHVRHAALGRTALRHHDGSGQLQLFAQRGNHPQGRRPAGPVLHLQPRRRGKLRDRNRDRDDQCDAGDAEVCRPLGVPGHHLRPAGHPRLRHARRRLGDPARPGGDDRRRRRLRRRRRHGRRLVHRHRRHPRTARLDGPLPRPLLLLRRLQLPARLRRLHHHRRQPGHPQRHLGQPHRDRLRHPALGPPA